MSRSFNDIPADFCLESCPNKELEAKTQKMYSSDKLYASLTTISCKHEDACQMWFDRMRNKNPIGFRSEPTRIKKE